MINNVDPLIPPILSISKFQFQDIDILGITTMRRILDGRRNDDEDSNNTMRRMNQRLTKALHLY